MSEDTPMYLAETLQLVKLVPTIALGNKSVQAVIQNPTSAIFPEVRLEGKVTKRRNERICQTDFTKCSFCAKFDDELPFRFRERRCSSRNLYF